MLMLTIETFLLLLLAGLLGLAVGWLIGCGRSADGSGWSDDKPWLRDGRAVPPAPVLSAAPTLLGAEERARLTATIAEAKTAAQAASAGASVAAAASTSSPGAVPPAAAAPPDEPAAAGSSEPAVAGGVSGGGRTEPPGTGDAAAAAPPPAAEAAAVPAEIAAAAVTPVVAPEDAERAAAADAVGTRPLALAGALGGKGDELTRIRGVGPQNEKKLHGLGVWHFAQIAAWTPDNAKWAGSYMAFPGRIEREDWIGQAKILAAGGSVEATGGAPAAPDDGGMSAGGAPAATDDGGMSAGGAPAAEVTPPAPEPAPSAPAAAAGDYALPAEIAAAAVVPTVAAEDAERAAAADAVGTRPLALAAPIAGKPDDLKRIRGIGPQNEKKLHGLGVWHFSQIAAWTAENAKWAGSFMAFPGRIEREDWIAQAKVLATGAETEFSKRVDAGDVPTSLSGGEK